MELSQWHRPLVSLVMQDPSTHYALANRLFAAAVCRVSDQRARVEHLRFGGHPIAEAESHLRLLERTLVLMRYHRSLLQAEMAEWLALQKEQNKGSAALVTDYSAEAKRPGELVAPRTWS